MSNRIGPFALAVVAALVFISAVFFLWPSESPDVAAPPSLQPANAPEIAVSDEILEQATPDGGPTEPVPRSVPGAIQVQNQAIVGTDELPAGLLEELSQSIVATSAGSNNRFESEPVDPTWAPGMEAAIYSVVSAASDMGEITEVECRTSICRAVVEHGESLLQLDNAGRQQYFERANKLFAESFLPLIMDSNGRLKSMSSSGRASLGDDATVTTIYTLSGPPLSNADSAEQ